MDEFKATIDSLGEWTLSNLRAARRIEIIADALSGTARMEIFLQPDTWQERDAAIEQMVEIRGMFMDELAISYSFADSQVKRAELPEDSMAYVYA